MQGRPHRVFRSGYCPLMDRYQGHEITRQPVASREERDTPALTWVGRGRTHHCSMRQPASHDVYFILVFNPKTMEPFWLPINLTEQVDEVGCAGRRIF